jgi:hypothetical protein
MGWPPGGGYSSRSPGFRDTISRCSCSREEYSPAGRYGDSRYRVSPYRVSPYWGGRYSLPGYHSVRGYHSRPGACTSGLVSSGGGQDGGSG